VPTTGTMIDLMYEEIVKHTPTVPPGVESMMKGSIKKMISALIAAGWQILPPGALPRNTAYDPAPAKAPAKAPVAGTSVRCPGCGEIDPDLGFKSEFREVPLGKTPVQVAIAYVFCANETCHTILSVAASKIPPQERGAIQ